MLRTLLSLTFVSFALASGKSRVENEARLKRDLFFEYDTTILPNQGNDSLPVHIGMAMIKMDLNHLGELTIDHWIRAMWNDYRLSWDPKEYGGVEVLRIPASEVWKPDLKLYNELEHSTSSQMESTDVNSLVYPDGTVLLIPPLHNKVQCEDEVEFANWPWGEYACNIKIGSWTVDGYKLSAALFVDGEGEQNGIDVEFLMKNSPFVFSANSFTEPSVEVKYYSCCKEPYPAVNFKFHVFKQYDMSEEGTVIKNPNRHTAYKPKKYKLITPGSN